MLQLKSVISDTDVGTEELAHLEIVGSIISQLTSGEGAKSFDRYGVADYYVDHSNAVYPQSAAGAPFTAAYLQSKGDPIADITEDLAAEQKARATYDNILRLSDDPDVNNVIRFLREREVVHFQRFGDTMLAKLKGDILGKNTVCAGFNAQTDFLIILLFHCIDNTLSIDLCFVAGCKFVFIIFQFRTVHCFMLQ